MAESGPNKSDITAIFKHLRNQPANKVCFDCNAKNPTWSSVTYGVFICIDCSAVHRGLGVHLTFVRSTQLDTNWTWIQLRQMQLGGNANASSFFRQHNCSTNDAQQKYNSRAAQLYREKLHQSAIQAMRIHGNKINLKSTLNKPGTSSVHLDVPHEPVAAKKEEEADFFEQNTQSQLFSFNQPTEDILSPVINKPVPKKQTDEREPNVSAIQSGTAAVVHPPEPRKSTIGARKPAAKSGLGARKGLGAQRVKANFDEIEREAQMNDEIKIKTVEEVKKPTEEEEEQQLTSMRLAYQDLSVKQKREEERVKQFDKNKAQQVERLGMGFSNRSGISHSAISDMKAIEQEGVVEKKKLTMPSSRSTFESDFFDDFQSGFSMYKSSEPKSTGSAWGTFDESEPASSSSSSNGKRWTEPEPVKPAARSSANAAASEGDAAQKKFGSAKAISSDQYFHDSESKDWERKTNLQRFEGSSSISSADYFDDGSGSSSQQRSNSGPAYQSPDLEDVRESVRQGVTKVAGKLSNLANGVMNSFQERYGY
ncbi:ADP-ribosylation factor GTPase-activating protein 2 isoform X2 [Neocloeon triangulifer]|uniref:ADP-ribosylation factor GTPase-activating protein 2 isoform X2 n=1 Tax=Neocloeon triangulifer TaxID=2078957 RepID=UPI00286F1B96|nr:ADP-ribosylation factor GTPase-activating protein 2 isoform X2 [Neocloeon triangulifer]